jgi:signal recognition particle receptor subunit beta
MRAQAAALLFDVLVAEELGAATPLLVFCNKGDLAGAAKSSDRVQGLLERELDALRKVHTLEL